MADIVQLEEKGNLLYPKTHVSAVEDLPEILNTNRIMATAYFTQSEDVANKHGVVNIPLELTKENVTGFYKFNGENIVEVKESGLYEINGALAVIDCTGGMWTSFAVVIENNGNIVNPNIEGRNTANGEASLRGIFELKAGSTVRIAKNGSSSNGKILRCSVIFKKID
ncbi:hypothetical protein BCR24_12290 [Enterococcus ureilyticus]|uniref:Uncharacterized protein n=1 Tax=Enterococcus ureilyticus TaxID=1131292 RepID=A0A1E5HEC9_9ENTE|nr:MULTISPECIES: hypothetical protein [Enterococcus]MBM7689541.1 hypothetical protein [Enterococcus ureilyticus]MBO0422635.1 hypothetical protein [Enterococcus plantarum]MBO0446249.1 hypothetical protein [Enterococcus ureilyticus]OEG23294.1 hypothetical protein BCR24_12290 [Enterococcus ureilyticus]